MGGPEMHGLLPPNGRPCPKGQTGKEPERKDGTAGKTTSPRLFRGIVKSIF